jgi:DNA polymerase-3 subunit epsilon
MDFFCLDVETANESASSICQIGIATFVNSEHRPELDIQTYINPEDYFLDELTDIHGISEQDVAGAPTYRAIHPILSKLLAKRAVLGHSHFDRVSIIQANSRYALPTFEAQWLDTLLVARRAWPERRGNGGHGLRVLADHFGIEFRHHSALEDAWCAGQIFLRACEATGLSLEDWLVRVKQPIAARSVPYPDGNPDGLLFGEIVVFTGQLSIVRPEMSALASIAGCRVDEGVTKHTTLVVVGTQDPTRLKGAVYSRTHEKARGLIAKGKPVRIVNERDFLMLLEK